MLPDFRVRQRDYLLEISRALTEELDLEKVLTRIVRLASELLASSAGLIALREVGGGWRVSTVHGINQEFLKFLKKIDQETEHELDIHLIIDNYCTHKHERVARWLGRHKRFHLHFIPTSSSWLNLIERWFREITDKRIRRGAFKSVPELIEAIMDFIEAHNADPQPFIWSAPVERILSKIAKCKEALGTLH